MLARRFVRNIHAPATTNIVEQYRGGKIKGALESPTTALNMSSPTADQGRNATKEVEQSTTETVSANDSSKSENNTDSGTSQEQLQQTGPGPKVLRSHYRGMPRQWEKNQPPKKEGE